MAAVEEMGVQGNSMNDDGASAFSAVSDVDSSTGWHDNEGDGEDHEIEMSGGTEGSGRPQKRARDAKYAIPTMEEASLLRETNGKLFEGNLLRLEVEELLGEVRVDYDKKSVRALEEWLHALKDALENLPPATVTEGSLDLRGIRLANHVPEKPVTLDFRPPDAGGFDVAGSFLLRSLAKPSLNVDLVLRIPSECVVARDALNHRYLDKRALYVGHLAAAFLQKEGLLSNLVDKVELSYFAGDPRKPVVLLYPSVTVTKKGKPVKVKASEAFVVRLLPACARNVMPPARLAPHRNNVRTRHALAQLSKMTGGDEAGGGGGEDLVAQLPATPHYNSAILEDMTLKEHLVALHGLCGDSEAFRDAVILGKVWLGQHGMRTTHDSLGGYGWTMLLLHLQQARRVNARMAAMSIFQVALKFIADGGLSSKCLTVDTFASGSGAAGARAMTTEEENLFKKAFPAVMVDTSLGFNVFARLSASAVQELEMTAKASIRVLQGRPGDAFRRLLMTRTTVWRKCDSFVQVPLQPAVKRGQRRAVADGQALPRKADQEAEEAGLLDKPLWCYVSERVTALLREGLGDRCTLARPLCGADGEAAEDFRGFPGPPGWHPRSPPPPPGCFAGKGGGDNRNHEYLTVGLVIDPASAGRLVDKGPPAEEGAAARKFREFWGERSELRRFKDGSIVEAVVWTGKGAQRHRVVEQIVRHVLARHDPSRCGTSAAKGKTPVRFRGTELLGLVTADGIESLATEDDELTRSALKAFDELQQQAKAVVGMPLRVEGLQATSPLLRYTSIVPPAPHPLAFGAVETPSGLPPGTSKLTSQIEPLEAILRLESSNKWPADLEAVRNAGIAFLIRLAQCLEKQHKLRCVVGRRFLDVITAGYCFRLRIGGDRELSLIGANKDTAQERLLVREAAILSAPHHSSMHGLHLQKPAYGLIVRAAARWLEEHMMADHLRMELLELLVASLFSDEAPLAPPATGLAGFLRLLLLIAGHDWESSPLVVDTQGELSVADRAAALEAFSRSRDRDPGGGDAMYVVAPYARDTAWTSSWSSPRPERPVLGRLVALARASSASLVEWLSGSAAGEGGSKADSAGWKKAFRMTSAEEETFDVTFSINAAVITQRTTGAGMCLEGTHTFMRRRIKGCAALQTKTYKNLARQGSGNRGASHGALVVGFDPIGDLVSEWRRRFGHLAVIFFPGPAGLTGKIGVIWRPWAFTPRPYNVARSRHGAVLETAEGGIMTSTDAMQVVAEMKQCAGDMVDSVQLA